MTTKHEAIAASFADLVGAAVSAKVTREAELPEDCPESGIINIVPGDPREIKRRLGTGDREFQRAIELEIVVFGETTVERLQRMEAHLSAIGAALTADALMGVGVDYLDLAPPSETDVIPMRGAPSLRGAVVSAQLYYETSNNVMETGT